MTDRADEELGPIDYLLIEFPPGKTNFDGALATELASLVEAEMIRILDLMIITKDADGNLDVLEAEDIEDLGELAMVETELAEILAEEDVDEPGRGDGAGKRCRLAGLGEHLGRARSPSPPARLARS